MSESARRVAQKVLKQVFENQSFTNLALQHALATSSLQDRDKALCTEIVYGTVQRMRTLDAMTQPYVKRHITELDADVRTVLRMTVYQIVFLTKVPAYAAIHEAVEMTKTLHPKASGFVNGVLRAFLRADLTREERMTQVEDRGRNAHEKLGYRHSYPTWYVKQLDKVYGTERSAEILADSNRPAQLTVRVNTTRTSVQDVLEDLMQELGPETVEQSKLYDDGIVFLRGVDLERISVFQQGLITVQDEGAMLISPLLHPKEDERILDMCAAPGSKTTHLAALAEDHAHVVACDLYPHKLKLIREAASRLQLSSIQTKLSDARLLLDDENLHGAFDKILLDAPCSGFGVLRHRPDIRYKRSQRDVRKLAQLQVELLETAIALLKPGGTLVYSTCTILPEENEDVIREILARYDSMQLDPITDDLPERLKPFVSDEGYLTLTPELFHTDGFFMARLQKKRGG